MYWITGILGMVFAMCPFLLGYSDNIIALWTSLVLGGSVVILSFVEGYADDKDSWEYTVAAFAGLVAIVSPFILGFSHIASAMWTSVVAGVLIALFAGGKLFYDQESFQ